MLRLNARLAMGQGVLGKNLQWAGGAGCQYIILASIDPSTCSMLDTTSLIAEIHSSISPFPGLAKHGKGSETRATAIDSMRFGDGIAGSALAARGCSPGCGPGRAAGYPAVDLMRFGDFNAGSALAARRYSPGCRPGEAAGCPASQ